MDLAWSWNRQARSMFRRIDEHLWVRCRHDPFQLFALAGPERLAKCAVDPDFLRRYDDVIAWLDSLHSSADTWFARAHPGMGDQLVAYFCAEFALHHTVPIYSGGLGVLAGDHCKAASDLGVPLVGIGMLYRGGHFDQHIRPDGWQEESNVQFDLGATALRRAEENGRPLSTTVEMNGREVTIQPWLLQAGRTRIYLLDTQLERNHPEDRTLLSNLYPAGHDRRLRQEWLLGVGGVRLLQALGLTPTLWHANEGHAAFMLIERVRALVAEGVEWDDAIARVREASVFTTHTPVPAGHDVFNSSDVARCAGSVLGDDPGKYLSLGVHPQWNADSFHMTVAALRLSKRVNGVSEVHGAVSRRMWHVLWPDLPEDQVPIGHVTNGVHPETWLASRYVRMLDASVGRNPVVRAEQPYRWEFAEALDDTQVWRAHQNHKERLLRLAREESRAIFVQRTHEAGQLVGSGVLLDPQVLTLGFARRFATYKRASLVFYDVDRLIRILTNPARPVQIIFAGKAHPADHQGKLLLQEVYRATHDPRFEGRIAFIEDYDHHIAHLLVQGVDAWLNLPRVPLEACGTSGMKAALNGVPHVSTLDGWWAEAADGMNGWTVPTAEREEDDPGSDGKTANALYDLLEREIVPAFYERDADELPRRWIGMMKHAIRVAGSRFSAHRMLMDYVKDYYVPAAEAVVSSGA